MKGSDKMDDLQDIIQTLESTIRLFITMENTNSISEMAIIQIGTLIDAEKELLNIYVNIGKNEQLKIRIIEIIEKLEIILERMTRSYERCSLVNNSNNDILVYNRSYQYIIDKMVNDFINVQWNQTIENLYKDVFIILFSSTIQLANNARRFQLCRELVDILREINSYMSKILQEIRRTDNL